jgi:hypothetical protein
MAAGTEGASAAVVALLVDDTKTVARHCIWVEP